MPVAASEPDSRPRFAGLDGLRAIAVVLVIWFHFGPPPGLHRLGILGQARAGYLGAQLFFVVSGFLITALLLDERARSGRIHVGAFYTRRVFRLLPALGLALVVLAVANVRLHEPVHETVIGAAAAIGYQFNIVAYLHTSTRHPELGGVAWGHLWSLSVEEQFYLVWPFVLGWALRRRADLHRLAQVLALACVAVGAWRTLLWWRGAPTLRLYLLTDTRFDGLLAGAALAALAAAGSLGGPDAAPRSRRLAAPVLLAGVVALAFGASTWDTTRSPGWMFGPGLTLFSVLGAALVHVVVHPTDGLVDRLLRWRPTRAIGRRSYGLYLFHYPARALALGRPGAWVLAVVGTVVAAELSYRLVEQPLLRRTPAWARTRRTQQVETGAAVAGGTGGVPAG